MDIEWRELENDIIKVAGAWDWYGVGLGVEGGVE